MYKLCCSNCAPDARVRNIAFSNRAISLDLTLTVADEFRNGGHIAGHMTDVTRELMFCRR